jgi:hypothetical protein
MNIRVKDDSATVTQRDAMYQLFCPAMQIEEVHELSESTDCTKDFMAVSEVD